jgi:hypothetical protein
MTSCLIVIAPDRLVAVADGRLSIDDHTISFDTTMKIVQFQPRYQIPHVSMGRFSHFTEYTARNWFVAYAGTYALVAEVLNLFREQISGRLHLVWQHNEAVLSNEFDRNCRFDDYYNFLSSDYIKITPDLVARKFRGAAQEKCDEWSRNRRLFPDCEFLLFGEDPDGRYVAFKVTVNQAGWIPGASVRIQVDPIRDGNLTIIGSLQVANAAFGDGALVAGLEGWRENQSQIELANMLADFTLDDISPDLGPQPPLPAPAQNWSVKQVEERFQELLRHSGDASVGGEFIVASGVWSGGISLRSET